MNPLRMAGLAVLGCLTALIGTANTASASPSVVVDVKTGAVLEHVEATRPWYPASLTKLLTVYVALSAVRDGRVTMDTPFVVSARAASMPPSKMGFKPGTEVTLNNALKMLMVKSANDLAIMIAEGISGSVEDFAAEMNRTAAKLGMKDSHFANPNGLPNPDHYSSARDLAIVARALFRDFPQDDWLYGIGAFRLGKLVVPTYNNLLGRYPGVNGMKTGYTCASGFNIVVSAVRGGRHLIAVVMGAPNIKERTETATALLDAAFEGVFPNGPQLGDLPKSTVTRPTDIRSEVCGRHRKIVAESSLLPPQLRSGPLPPAPGGLPPRSAEVRLAGRPHFNPIPVFVGPEPGWTGPIAEAKALPASVSAYASDKASAGPLAPDPKAASLHLAGKAKKRFTRAARPRRRKLVRRHLRRVARRAPPKGRKAVMHASVATRRRVKHAAPRRRRAKPLGRPLNLEGSKARPSAHRIYRKTSAAKPEGGQKPRAVVE